MYMKYGYEERKRFWTSQIEEQRKSQKTKEEWCEYNNLKLDRFLVWEERLKVPIKTRVFEPIQIQDEEEPIKIKIGDYQVTCDKSILKDIIGILK